MRCVPTLLLVAIIGGLGAAEEPTTGATLNQKDADGNSVSAQSQSQMESDLTARYNDFLGKYGISPLSEKLFDTMVKENSKTYLDYEKKRSEAVSSGTVPGGYEMTTSLAGGWGATKVSLGGEITDLGAAPANFPSVTETVHFIEKGGPNRLGKLDEKMKRASGWLNKHTCGGFDWSAQFNFLFKLEVLKEYVKQLGEGVVAAAPMALLGAFSPQLAEAVKHLKLIAGMDLSATKMDCQTIQNALTGGLDKAKWGIAYNKCLSDKEAAGISDAVKTCQAEAGAQGWMSDPAGDLFQTVNSGVATAGNWVDKQKDRASDWFGSAFKSDSDSTTQTADAQAAAANVASGTGPADPNEQNATAAKGSQTGEAGKYFNAVGKGMTSVMKDLFGSVTFNATGGMEVGRKRMDLFNVQFKVHGNQLREKLIEQIDDHYDEISAGVPSPTDLAASYRNLHTWTLRTRGGIVAGTPAWTKDPYSKLSKVEVTKIKNPDGTEKTINPYDQRITNKTFDNLAALRFMEGMVAGNPSAFSEIERKYGVSKFVDALAYYELLLFVYEQGLADAKTAFIAAQGTASAADTAGGKDQVADKLKPIMESTEQDILKEIGEYQATILTYLYVINNFDPIGMPGFPNRAGNQAPRPITNTGASLPSGGY